MAENYGTEFAKVEGTKVYARMKAEDDWVHVETITNPNDAHWLVSSLNEDDARRQEYVDEPLS